MQITMNMTDCSVGSNPLAQLNKHAQGQGSSLSNPHVRHSGGVSGSNVFRSGQNVVSEDGRQQLNSFMSQPMRLGEDKMHPATPMGSSMGNAIGGSMMQVDDSSIRSAGDSQWTREFRQNTAGKTNMAQEMGSSGAAMANSNAWKFRYSPMTNVNNTAPLRPFNNIIRQKERANGLETGDIAWNDKFDELEKEVSDKLNFKDGETVEKMDTGAEMQQDNLETGDSTDYQKEFQEVWDSIQQDTEEMLSYKDDYEDMLNDTDFERSFLGKRAVESLEYKFENPSENQYMNNPNAYQIGCILMENGAKLSEAALAFEAAIKQDPKHVDAWLKLGIVQIQNEKELNGMSALETCLKLDPNNLEAMKNLAISYINEGYDMSAYNMLNRWADTKYPGFYNSAELEGKRDEHENIHSKMTRRFLSLVNRINSVDPDIQLCLGLLFYANDEFDRTIDCFQAALKVNPNDELMWNRLGASLANSNRSEEAIQAYHRALQLKPSFVRARYNLAVSSMNIGCYKEAAEHLLTALSMHDVEGEFEVQSTRSNSISSADKYSFSGFKPTDNLLETLKRVFISMGRDDLLDRVRPGMDLSQFRNEFTF